MMRAKKVFEIKRSGDAIPLIGAGRSVIAPAYDHIMRTWPNWFNKKGFGDLSESNLPIVNAFTQKACEVMGCNADDIMLAWGFDKVNAYGSPEKYIQSFFSSSDHEAEDVRGRIEVQGNTLPVAFRHIVDMGIAEVYVSIPIPGHPTKSKLLKYYLIRK
jgi:hypothetical protein